MLRRLKKYLLGIIRRRDGAVTVEMAIMLPLFLLLAAGIMDFGHAWYMRQVITNASREGARYGITYQTNTNGARIKPNALSPTIQTKVNQYLSSLLPANASPTVTCGGTGYGAANPSGLPINVNVSAKKYWWIVGGLLPGLTTYQDINVTTTMNCE